MNEKFYSRLSDTEIVKEMHNRLQDILMRHWLFGSLPGHVISDLSYQFMTRKYEVGQYVFHQDDVADNLFVILDGEVSIESVNIDGKVTPFLQLNQGDIFGEFGLIDTKGRSASAQVLKPAILAALGRKVFDDLIANYPSFSKNIMEILVGRLRSANQQVESLVTMSLMQRTAQILLHMHEKSGPDLKVTQNELAERLFATREKVNSKLKELERLGAVKTGRGAIKIVDPARLNALLDH